MMERNNLDDLRVKGMMILNGFPRNGMDWIALAQDRAWWRALVNAVMNLRLPQKCGKFLD
jgi:hypothetical protein